MARGDCVSCLARGHRCETENTIDGKFVCVFCEDEVPCPVDQRQGSSKKPATAAPRQAKKAMTQPIQECRADGCRKSLTARNRSGFCQQHFYLSHAKKQKRRGVMPPRNGRAKPVRTAKESSNSVTRASSGNLTVTEQQIDRMFLAWPFADKLAAIQAFLEQV